MIDFMVMEAVMLKIRKEDEAARKDAERQKWKKDREHLKQ